MLTLWSAAAGCNNRMPMCIGSFSLHSKWIGLSKRYPNSSVLRRDVESDRLIGNQHYITCSPVVPLQWMGAVRIRVQTSRPGVLPATPGSWCASAVGDPSKPLTLHARWTWPPSPWRRRLCKPQRAWRPVPGTLLPEGMKGLTTGWRFGGRLEWLGPSACRSATPTSGLGHGASIEAVSYGAAPAAWPPPQPPYAPGASETVSVVPRPVLECIQAVQHRLSAFLREARCLIDRIQTPYREKRSSASARVCSFPSWPEGPTGWGARAPIPVFA